MALVNRKNEIFIALMNVIYLKKGYRDALSLKKNGGQIVRIVIVEERPWKMKESIKKIQNMGLIIEHLIYACFEDDIFEATQERVEDMCNELGIAVTRTDHYQFTAVLDEFYTEPDIVFFCDYNLYLSQEKYPDERINVIYAKKKMQEENGMLNRIWFYTTAGENANEQINTCFPGHNITVSFVRDNQVLLDFDEVERIKQKADKF